MIGRPLFIIGNPRSGTSLLRLMLTNHSDICIPPECGFIQWWFNKYGNWTKSDTQNKIKVESFITDLSQSKKIETWNLDFKKLSFEIETEAPESYPELCKLVIKRYANQQQKKPFYLGDKNNYYLKHLSLISELFPDARFVSIVRDGRDIACSYRKLQNLDTTSPYKPQLSVEIRDIALEWVSNLEKTEKLFTSLEKDNYIWVRYEDLVTLPQKTLQRLSDFLDIPYQENMLNYYTSHLEPKALLAWKKKTLEKPDASNTKKYLKELSKEEVSEFEAIGQDMLKAFNYV